MPKGKPGTGPYARQPKAALAERIAKELREEALRLKQEAAKMEAAASVMDGKR